MNLKDVFLAFAGILPSISTTISAVVVYFLPTMYSKYYKLHTTTVNQFVYLLFILKTKQHGIS